eukprot:TRINITY_DN49537_c0_g1_i1.p1 TRINITY_DN49537_c0_g1~~TRINITY_DN49537_c0_g1_i1.p1  ORF type:complete len:532 (-),score=72.86 TRINITY_DN49537_c0_g1_i1:69-1664(-)
MVFVWSALLNALIALPTASTTAIGVVDLAAKGTPFAHYWKRCVGSGHMLLGTREDWRNHLRLAVKELGFTGVRGHGLLDDDMSVLPRKGGDYEFYNVDQVFDFLTSLQIKPVVELSFMPRALAPCGEPGQRRCDYPFGSPGSYKGLTMTPDNYEDWYALIKALADHLVQRYGLAEVSTWHFEVWNEMWGVVFPEPYLTLYNASARALKSVSESLRVGGPATQQTESVDDFIQAVQNKIPVDFVSTHFYPTDPQCQTQTTKNDPDCFAHTVMAAQKSAEKAGLPFFITEYNNGLDSSSRDDSSAAAFVFRQIGLLDRLDMLSWWTFTDVFEEDWMRSTPFHNGFGMMTVHGIRKPVWRAFEMLAEAGDKRLPVSGSVSPEEENSDISILATQKDSGEGAEYRLYVARYHRLGDASRSGSNGSVASVGKDLQDVKLILRHRGNRLETFPDFVDLYRIDEEHANPMAKWKELGSPKYPSVAQVDQISAASDVGLPEKVKLVVLNDTASALTLQVPANSASLVRFAIKAAATLHV